MRKIFFILILAYVLAGCSWFGPKTTSKRVNPDDLVIKIDKQESDGAVEHVKNGSIINFQKLKEGGLVIVVPFSPGANIEANDEFDRITLRMIRGVVDEFEKENSKFDILSAKNGQNADFILEGRVIEVKKPSLMKGVMLKTNRYRISVQGKLIDAKTEKSVVVFSDTVESKYKNETLDVLSAKIGRKIGRFITSGKSIN